MKVIFVVVIVEQQEEKRKDMFFKQSDIGFLSFCLRVFFLSKKIFQRIDLSKNTMTKTIKVK